MQNSSFLNYYSTKHNNPNSIFAISQTQNQTMYDERNPL